MIERTFKIFTNIPGSRHLSILLSPLLHLDQLERLSSMSEIDRTRRSHRPSPSPRAIAASAAASTSKPKNAAEVQRAQLEKLFVDPSREVYIPAPPKAKTLAPPRDMIPNVQGSSAGAGTSLTCAKIMKQETN